ncbi:MAG: hypothetical protein ABIJ09_03535 [Pseudomonadota bacterium]
MARSSRTVPQTLSLLATALILTTACPKEPVAAEGACQDSSQCPEGYLCADRTCAKACNRNLDCPRQDQACTNGACLRVPDPACAGDSDCTTPNDCQLADGAACRAGSCVYASQLEGEDCDDEDLCTVADACDGDGHCVGRRKECTTRPAAECVAGDSVYRSYADRGVCLPASGECSYAPVDVECRQCATTCLIQCEDLRCDQYNGGCRFNGRCLPGATATCEFELADNGTLCDLASEPAGSQGGRCAAGECVGCSQASDCTEPPGDHAECFTGACEPSGCAYTPRPGESCGQPFCRAGYMYPMPLCDNAGACLDGNRVSCNGLRCNAGGTACLTSCSGDPDCMPGAFCNTGTGQCEGLLDDGEDCSAAGATQCLSGYCDGLRCCSGGDCCNDPLQCPADYSTASACHDVTLTTACQGSRREASCVDHVCGSVTVDDDSACAGLSHGCPDHLAARTCTGAVDQAAPECPASCSVTAPCEDGYQCSGTQCVPIPGVGDACTGTGQGTCNSGLKCENSVCCVSTGGTCCTGSSQCSGGLVCNTGISSCAMHCSDYTTSSCADPGGTVCLGDVCVAKQGAGADCGDGAQCQTGFCVDGVCCNVACGGACEACRGTLNGGNNGTCSPVPMGLTDLAPTAMCTATGTGCSGASCACDGARTCKSAVGQTCTQASQCARAVCECADEQCATRKCAVQACTTCQYTTNGSLCTVGLGESVPVDDVGECSGDRSCYAGVCKGDDGRGCATDVECGHGHCECGDAGCTPQGQKCSAAICPACKYTITGAACDGNLTDSTPCNDSNACTQTDSCQGGACTGSNPVQCTSPLGCETSPGSCNVANGSCSYGLAAGNTVCRAAAAGGCDVAEVCNGTDRTCPQDVFRPGSYACHPSAGDCDPAEYCPSNGPACPADQKSVAECRAQNGTCDLADFCDGVGNSCPTTDRVRPITFLCGSASDLCDADDYCDGVGKTCPDAVKGNGVPCGTPAGACDVQDHCNGTSKTCPDQVAGTNVECRAALDPICDTAENCDGTHKTCPGDTVATWHSDCGTCRWCENGRCEPNSSDHSDCSIACQQCQTGSCVAATPGTDPRGNDCPGYDCANTVAGWTTVSNQGRCTAFTGTTAANNGFCSGQATCYTPAQSCTGAVVIATCTNWSCARKAGNSTPENVACVPGSARSTSDSVTEACWTSNVTTTECRDIISPPDFWYYYCRTGGECFNWDYYFSCPMLYTWDGQEFAFESDMYTSGTLGLKLGYGYRKPDPHDAYVLRHPPAIVDGVFDLRIVEELEELDYLDEARLYAIDLPPDRDLVSRANNVPLAPIELERRLVTISTQRTPLVSAVHLNSGVDVAATLASSDGQTVMLSEDPNSAYWNSIVADLGSLAGASIVKLVVDGTSRFSSTPEGILNKHLNDPNGWQTTLEVIDTSGNWVQVSRSRVTLVKPKEFPRVMAIDITGIFPTADHRVRMSWFNKTYLDAIWIDTTPDLSLSVVEAPLQSVTLARHGFSAFSGGDQRIYHYAQPGPPGWPLPPGAFTRYGDVTPLLTAADDIFAIFGPGDEVGMRFVPPAPPPAGLRRVYAMQTLGYYKQSSLVDGGAVPFMVAPLPFAAMSNFPYDESVEHYPDDPAHQDYLRDWNTRIEGK